MMVFKFKLTLTSLFLCAFLIVGAIIHVDEDGQMPVPNKAVVPASQVPASPIASHYFKARLLQMLASISKLHCANNHVDVDRDLAGRPYPQVLLDLLHGPRPLQYAVEFDKEKESLFYAETTLYRTFFNRIWCIIFFKMINDKEERCVAGVWFNDSDNHTAGDPRRVLVVFLEWLSSPDASEMRVLCRNITSRIE